MIAGAMWTADGGLSAQETATPETATQETDNQETPAPLPPLEEQAVAEDTSLKALRLVQTYMDTVQSLEARFYQRAPDGGVASGKLSLARPGRVRFDYEGDVPFLVVADGKTLNFVDYEIGQVTRWPVKDTPLRALLGGSTDLASIGANIETAPFGNNDLLALHATDVDRPELGHITVYFQQLPYVEEKLRLLRWDVTDAQGQITTVEIADAQVNVDLAADLWDFEDPRGLAKRRRTR